MKAWTYQDPKQLRKHGPEKSSWYVGWYDPAGKRCCESCGPGARGQATGGEEAREARSRADRGHLPGPQQAHLGPSSGRSTKERILAGRRRRERELRVGTLEHFERIVRPGKLSVLKTSHVDDFIAARRRSRGKKTGSLLSPASINKDLRHLKAALRGGRTSGAT